MAQPGPRTKPVYFRTFNIPTDATCVHCENIFTDEERRSGHGAIRDILGNLAHNRCHQEKVQAIPGLCTGSSKDTGMHKSTLARSFSASDYAGIGR